MSEESPKQAPAQGRYLHRFKVRKITEEVKPEPPFPQHLQKTQKEKSHILPQERGNVREAQSEGGATVCESRAKPFPHKCKMLLSLVEIQHRNDHLRRKKIKLQEKINNKDEEIKALKKLLDSDSDSSDSSSAWSETIEVVYAL